MRRSAPAVAMLTLLALAACHQRAASDAPAKVSVTAKVDSGDSGPATAAAATGKVAITAPGFDLKVDVPSLALGGDDFELDGVKLYPGSKVTGVAVAAERGEGDKHAKIDVGFTSPADAATVRAWFIDKLGDRLDDTAAMTGETRDGNDFRIELTPAARGSTGTIHIDG